MKGENIIEFESTLGSASLREAVTDIKIEGAGKYTFVQLSDSHIAVYSDRDDEDTVKLVKHERDIQWGGSCIEAGGIRTDLCGANAVMRERADSLSPDAVFITGDIADLRTETIFEEILKYKSEFKSPVHFIGGNHDTIDVADDYNSELHALSDEIFGENRTYEEIHYDGFDVLCFSTFFLSISDKQIEFLKEKLKGNKPLILFMHSPVYTDKLLEVTGSGFIEYYTVGADQHNDNAKAFAELIKINKDKIVAVFAGHCHFHLDHDADETDFKQYVNSTAFSGFYRIININH